MNKNNQISDEKIGRLLANLGRLHAKRLDAIMERIGLYRGQAILITRLSSNDGMTHSEIADKLEISPAAATKVIKRMEDLGYVQRRPDAGDERISHVFLLDEGWKLVRKIRDAFLQVDEILVSDLSTEEQRMLIQLLTRVYSSLLNQSAEFPSTQERLIEDDEPK